MARADSYTKPSLLPKTGEQPPFSRFWRHPTPPKKTDTWVTTRLGMCSAVSALRAALGVPGDLTAQCCCAGHASRGAPCPCFSPATCRGTAARRSPPSPGTTQSGRGRCQWFSGTRFRSKRSPAHRWPATQKRPCTDQRRTGRGPTPM